MILFISWAVILGLHQTSSQISLFHGCSGEWIRTDQFLPLEDVQIRCFPPKQVTSLEFQVKDSKGQVLTAFTTHRNEVAEFKTGGPLGQYTVEAKSLEATIPWTKQTRYRLIANTEIYTGNPLWDSFYGLTKEQLIRNRRMIQQQGRKMVGYRSPDTYPVFLRDHVYQMRGFKFFEADLKSTLDYFLSQQNPDGSFMECYWINPQTKKFGISDNLAEADKEYLMVWGVYQAWQVTGDDTWMKQHLPRLEKGLQYSMTHPFRWSKEYQLVKRPFTIDTWDFEYHNPGMPYNEKKAKMGIMHGDNSGMYMACRKLSQLYSYTDNTTKAAQWNQKAQHFQTQLNKVSWNGKFYRHQVHIDPVTVINVKEEDMLSLSNPLDINRGVASHAQAISILNEYRFRYQQDTTKPFAEWYSINPPFPAYSFNTMAGSWSKYPYEYVNGGIMPLVGGELAKAGFDHGLENYGAGILEKYYSLVTSHTQGYLWYHPDGKPGISNPEMVSADGWGASAMLNAYVEGLMGIHDNSKLFQSVTIRPAWSSISVSQARVVLKYAPSNAYCAYEYSYDTLKNRVRLDYTGSGNQFQVMLLLPTDKEVIKVSNNSRELGYSIQTIEQSRYLVFTQPFLTSGWLEVQLK